MFCLPTVLTVVMLCSGGKVNDNVPSRCCTGQLRTCELLAKLNIEEEEKKKKKYISQNNNSLTTSSVLNNIQCFTNNII